MRHLLAIVITILPSCLAAADWPNWRGHNRNAVSPETGLAKSWQQPPKVEWHATGLGQGYSSVVIANGLLVTTGSFAKDMFCIALDANTGVERWRTKVGETSRNVMSTPTLHAGLVYVVDPDGELICLEAKSGHIRWERNLLKEFGGRLMSGRGYGESPLIDGDRLICTPGGPDAMVVALDRTSGKTIWQSKIPHIGTKGRDGAAFASISISRAAGVKQYVTLCGRGLIGLEAESGKFLWGYNDISNQTANIPTPIVSGDYVFSANGYHAGSVLLKIAKTSEGIAAHEVYRLKGNRFQNHHGGFVLIDGHIYGGHGSNNGLPTCLDLETGKIKWKRRGPGSGSASVVAGDGQLVFKYQDGVVALIQATPDEFNLNGTFKVPNTGADGWSHPVISDGKLFIREKDDLWVYNIRSSNRSTPTQPSPNMTADLAALAKLGLSVKKLSAAELSADESNLLRFAQPEPSDSITGIGLSRSDLTSTGAIQPQILKALQEYRSSFVLSLAGLTIAEPTFAQAAQLKNMTGLSVELCQNLNANCFKSLAQSESLRVLIATSTSVSNPELKEIAHIPNLLALDLEVCDNVANESCSILSTMKNLRALNLKKTAFEKNRVSDAGLALLTQLKELEVLNLTGNAVTNEGLKSVATFSQLRCLSLNLVAINDSGLKHLQPLTELRQIDLLYSEGFAGTNVSDAGIATLAKFSKLNSLNLVGAKITDAAVSSLSKLKRLKKLAIVNTGLTMTAIQQLRQAIPGCEINSTPTLNPEK
jgi:outer membrane protein assembly factor BamB